MATVEELIKKFRTGNMFVQQNALEALCKMRDRRTIPFLMQILEERDSFFAAAWRRIASEALIEMKAKRAIPLIEEFVKENQKDFLAARVWANKLAESLEQLKKSEIKVEEIKEKRKIFCPKCGAVNEETNEFCIECGASLEKARPHLCPKCGEPVEKEATFCTACGAKLKQKGGE